MKKKVSLEEVVTLSTFLAGHGIEPAGWDICLFGDGSGSGWNQPCGWGCVSVERVGADGKDMVRRIWWGGVNNGTVNTAEGLAYFQPLNWFNSLEIERRKRSGSRVRVHRVHLFSDSQYCVQMGNGRERTIGKNGMIWAAYDSLQRHGFLLNWHWIRRDRVGLNIYTDLLSKLTRGLFTKSRLAARLKKESGRSVYDYLP